MNGRLLCTHTQPFNGRWSGTTQVGRYQKKLSRPSWSSDILHQLPPFTTIHSILCVQFMCLTVLSDNLSPGPLWSSSWSWALYFILHAFLHPVIIIFSQHMPSAQRSLFCCKTNAMSSVPSLSLNFLLGSLSSSLIPHIHLTVLISACWSATSFSFLTGQVSVPCNILLCAQLLCNLYTGAKTVVRTVYGNSKGFKVKVGMHQGSWQSACRWRKS